MSDEGPDDGQAGHHDKDVGGARQPIDHLLHPLDGQAAHVERGLGTLQQRHQQAQDPRQVLAGGLAHGGQGYGVCGQQAAAGDKVAVATAVAVQRVQDGVLDAGVALGNPGVGGHQAIAQQVKDARGQGPHLS